MNIASPFFSVALALLPSLLAVGCGLELALEPDANSNMCSSDDDCGSEGTCVSTQNGQALCVATAADLGGVILEVRPIGSEASIVFDSAVAINDQIDKTLVQNLDLTLPAAVEVTGHIDPPEALVDIGNCLGADDFLPVDVTLIRRVEFSPFASRYELPSANALDANANAAFSLAVPPGAYDLYLLPRLLDGCEAALPAPELRRGIEIKEGEPFEVEAVSMADAIELTGSLTVPINAELGGWVLEVLDPTYGYVISNQFALVAPDDDAIPIAGFSYHPTENALLRLRDLDGNLTIHWALDALLLASNGKVNLDLRDLVADPDLFTASVIDSAGAPVVSAGVIVQSVALTGSVTQNANYRVDTRTDAEGNITVSLVEGTYSVTIIPDVAGDAAYFGEWVVVAPEPEEEFGQGKAFALVVQPVLSGSVSDPLGTLLSNATVLVGPSQAITSDYFTRAVADGEPVKREFSTATLATGSFQLSVDPGEVDIAVQMPADSGYPWSVLPSFKVDAAELKPQLEIGEIQLRYPAILQGYVRDAGAAVPYAEIRAWVRPTDDGPLIQVGSVITDSDGGYVLPLPPGITIAETAPAESAEDEQ
jgi:hypothetical protein